MIAAGLRLLLGLALGLIMHLIVILILPWVADDQFEARISEVAKSNRTRALRAPPAGVPNRFALDPWLVYAVCRLDLAAAPGSFGGTVPPGEWSLALFDSRGTTIYSTTRREVAGDVLDLGVFTRRQIHLLADRRVEVAESTLVVESPSEKVTVVLRVAPPYAAQHDRFAEALDALTCGPIEVLE